MEERMLTIRMDQSLSYLHEVLSNYTEDIKAIQELDQRLVTEQYNSEKSFIQSLEEEEGRILGEILQKEMHHANQSGDFERLEQLNEVYEQLF